jgi:hypothetical protein
MGFGSASLEISVIDGLSTRENPHLDVCYDKPVRKEQGGESCLQILSIDVTWRPGTSKIGFSNPKNLGNEWSYVKFRQFYSVWRLCQIWILAKSLPVCPGFAPKNVNIFFGGVKYG